MIHVLMPFYFRDERSLQMLAQAIDSVVKQDYRPISILISDDSQEVDRRKVSKLISKFQSDFSDRVSFSYVHNTGQRGVSSNTNFAIRQVRNELVHVLHSDDIILRDDLYSKALSASYRCNSSWLVLGATVSKQQFIPNASLAALQHGLLLGVNPIGGPSGVIFRNSHQLKYNERLNNYCDLEFYYKLFSVFGPPLVLEEIFIEYGVGEWQVQKNFSSFENSVTEVIEIIKSNQLSTSFCMKVLLKGPHKIHRLLVPATALLKLKLPLLGHLLFCAYTRIKNRT